MIKNINKKTIHAKNFIKHFRRHLDLIISIDIKEDKICNIYKKLLLVALLDAIAKPIYLKETNKKKFILFIKKFSDWKYIDRISLPHLVQFLGKCTSPDFSNLRNYADSKDNEWLKSSVILLDKDLEFKEVENYWPKNKDKSPMLPLKGITIESLRHGELLYEYRNSLVHELTPPGISFQPGTEDDEPNYGSYTDLHGQHHWNLRYPVNFFIRLVKTCLNNLEEYLIEKRLDPLRFYKFGSYWFDEFNC